MICTFECTFCRACAEQVLANVCPNCGGGFCPRPVRPRRHWRGENYLGKYPPSAQVVHKPVNAADHRAFAARVAGIPPEQR
jgi:hypothetical protein